MLQALENTVTSKTVDGRKRSNCLPRYFGTNCAVFENSVYTFLGFFCKDYNGGYWEFEELSNGGFFMRLAEEGKLELLNPGNFSQMSMSAEAASIAVCLCVYSHLSFSLRSETFGEQYHMLRDYALSHAEAGAIFAIID